MVIIRRTDKAVVGDVHQLPQVQNTLFAQDDVVHKLLGSDASFLCLILDLLSMLIGARQELDIVALEPLVAGHGVSRHGAVCMADVQIGRRIINGSGNVIIAFALVAHN